MNERAFPLPGRSVAEIGIAGVPAIVFAMAKARGTMPEIPVVAAKVGAVLTQGAHMADVAGATIDGHLVGTMAP